MTRSVPTPARASKAANADPVAPQPTIAIREAPSRFWPSAPMPRNNTWREYRSSLVNGISGDQVLYVAVRNRGGVDGGFRGDDGGAAEYNSSAAAPHRTRIHARSQ